MLDALRLRQPGHTIGRVLWWHLLHFICFVWVALCYRYRSWGRHRVPVRGPVLFVANHQSFLDPILVGLGAHHRQFYAMARSTLFDHPLLAWLISSLNAVPVQQGESDTAAMRKCLDVLAQGHALLIFPEGARTLDGRTATLQRGMMLLLKRSQATVVPVAIEGAYAAWPRMRKLPRLFGRIGVMYGKPIPAAQLLAVKPNDALNDLRDQIERMRLDLSARLRQ